MDTGTSNSTSGLVRGIDDQEITTPETVETTVDAFKRLVIGAGKAAGGYNKVWISRDHGKAYDGVVATTVKYPFGISAKLHASDLARILPFLKNPTIKVGNAKVTFSESGKVFYLTRLLPDFVFPQPSKPEKLYDIAGSWLRRLQCVLPSTTSAFGLFNGVLACKHGFVGTDRDLLGHVKFDGPEEEYIIPSQLLQVLPSAQIRLGISEGNIWVESDDTVWTCPSHTGKFPPWQRAFFKPTFEAKVLKKEIRESLRAAGATAMHAWVEIEGSEGKVETFVLSSGEMPDAESAASIKFAVEKPPERKIRFAITIRKLLGILDSSVGDYVDLRTDDTFSRVYVIPATMQPKTEYLLATVRAV